MKLSDREKREIEQGTRWNILVRAGSAEYPKTAKCVQVIGRGRRAYVWVGNADERCIATISGAAALRQLRDALNEALDGGPQ